jgi:hypothetical protein
LEPKPSRAPPPAASPCGHGGLVAGGDGRRVRRRAELGRQWCLATAGLTSLVVGGDVKLRGGASLANRRARHQVHGPERRATGRGAREAGLTSLVVDSDAKLRAAQALQTGGEAPGAWPRVAHRRGWARKNAHTRAIYGRPTAPTVKRARRRGQMSQNIPNNTDQVH